MGYMAKLMKKKDRVPLHIKNLVAHVSSNASGCRYCQAHTIGEAEHNGATKEQLASLGFYDLVRDCCTNAGILLFGINPRFHLVITRINYECYNAPRLRI